MHSTVLIMDDHMNQKNEVLLGSIITSRFSIAEKAQRIDNACVAKPAVPLLVFSSNGQGIALKGSRPEYDAAMEAADLVHADGMSVVTASRLFTNQPIKERSCTTDLFHDIVKAALDNDLSFYVLGGSEEQNAASVQEMQRQYPDLRIVGRRDGYFAESESEKVCKEIVETGADILWVGLGKPKQEIWSHRYQENLGGVGCIKTCGGLYSYFAGDSPRAPLWVRRAGLEWLFRLLLEPRRLAKRYLITNAIAFVRLVMQTR